MVAPVIAAFAAVAVAVVGAFLSYWNTQRLHRRQERLARVNRQLGELYGPMLALFEANRRSYKEFLRKYRASSTTFFDPVLEPPDADQVRLWRVWVSNVFQPNNLRLYELIVTKADLLIDDEMPECLLAFCAHVSGFNATMARWAEEDYTDHRAVVPHPGHRADEYVRQSYATLRRMQRSLL